MPVAQFIVGILFVCLAFFVTLRKAPEIVLATAFMAIGAGLIMPFLAQIAEHHRHVIHQTIMGLALTMLLLIAMIVLLVRRRI